MDGRTDGRKWMDGWIGRQKDKWIDRWMEGRTDGQAD